MTVDYRKLSEHNNTQSHIRADKKLIRNTGLLGPLNPGSVYCELEDSGVYITAVINKNPSSENDYFPLMVDFRESYGAGGKIGGGSFMKREGRPSDTSILTSRLIDRSLRPLFPKNCLNDLVITITPLSIDKIHDPAVMSIIGSSLALQLSGIPFAGPIGACRLGYINDEFIINPTQKQLTESSLDLIVSGTHDTITMVECGGKEIDENIVIEGFSLGQKEINRVCLRQEAYINKVQSNISSTQHNLTLAAHDPVLEQTVTKTLTDHLLAQIFPSTKLEFNEHMQVFKNMIINEYESNNLQSPKQQKIKDAIFEHVTKYVRASYLSGSKRIDGRKFNEIRKLSGGIDLLPIPHGSALFTRGETQVINITTLGGPNDALIIDSMEQDDVHKRFMHHYSMPPFSVNEARGTRGPARREIGHGRLAEKAIEPVIPEETEFPYTIRAQSEVLSSNGSTSMAAVCAASLSLMDAGVPIKRPVSGIAMGLIINQNSEYVILTDIQGLEDFMGDMDFKIAGTEKGITALQMDMKVRGLPVSIIQQCIRQGDQARAEILKHMSTIINNSRAEPKAHAPHIIRFTINPESVKNVIGPGGSIINKIIKETEVQIDFQDDGSTTITAQNKVSAQKAKNIIEDMARSPSVGEKIEGKITRIEQYGIFVSIGKKTTGLAHIKNLGQGRINNIQKEYTIGQPITVEVIQIGKDGKIQLKEVI